MKNDFIPNAEYKGYRFYSNKDKLLGRTLSILPKTVSKVKGDIEFSYSYLKAFDFELEMGDDENEGYDEFFRIYYKYKITKMSDFLDKINKIVLAEHVINEIVWLKGSSFGYMFEDLEVYIEKTKTNLNLKEMYTNNNMLLDSCEGYSDIFNDNIHLIVDKDDNIIKTVSSLNSIHPNFNDDEYKIWINMGEGIFREYALTDVTGMEKMFLEEYIFIVDSVEDLSVLGDREDYVDHDTNIKTTDKNLIFKHLPQLRFREWVKERLIYDDVDPVVMTTSCEVRINSEPKTIYKNEAYKELDVKNDVLYIKII